MLRTSGWSTTQGLFFVDFIYCIWKKVRILCFYDFSWLSETNGMVPEVNKCPLKPINGHLGRSTTQGHLMHILRILLPSHFNVQVQNGFGWIWPRKPYMRRVCPRHDLILRKNGSETRMKFSMHKLKSPLKKQFFGGTVYEMCMQCMFRCADTILLWKWLYMDIGKS